jgi:hypothetical protein
MEKKILASAGVVIFIVCFLSVELSPSIGLTPIYRKTFTMIGMHVTPELARWCASLNFTDVWVRYDSNPEGSYLNLKTAGLTYRLFLSHDVFTEASNHSVASYKASILQEAASSPDGKFTVDDMNWGWTDDQSRHNFLEGLRELNLGDDITLVYQVTSVADIPSDNWHGLNVDVYHTPMTDLSLAMLNGLVRNSPKSLGMTLWAWGWGGPGNGVTGVTWQTITESLINKKYSEAEKSDISRMIVWNGYETNAHETGMNYSSLYNYPLWWSAIKASNERFLETPVSS